MTRILIVRRDNIGDLVCTLPLIASIRKLCPAARIDLLVNSYSAAVALGNPDIDNLYVYTKVKHRAPGERVLFVYARRIWITLKLRWVGYDWLVLANANYMPRPLRWARQIGAKNVVGFSAGKCVDNVLTHAIPFVRRPDLHEVEYLMQLLQPFGTVAEIPAAKIFPKLSTLTAARRLLCTSDNRKSLVAIHISARLSSQQWPAESFIELVRQLQMTMKCVLLWSPGDETTPGHPGDDEKAAEIINACSGLDLTPFPTQSLGQLIAAISIVDLLITPDGGAMHIGAACNKPIVALFGDSDSKQWYPWRVPRVVLHPESRHVRSITPQQVIEAVHTLRLASE